MCMRRTVKMQRKCWGLHVLLLISNHGAFVIKGELSVFAKLDIFGIIFQRRTWGKRISDNSYITPFAKAE
jgi:hypothetical protein